MPFEDPELVEEFVEESRTSLADIEQQFLAIESAGENVDHDLVNTVFRAIHSMKGTAGFLGLTTVNKLAHVLESVLDEVRNDKLVPTSDIVDVMLAAADQLCSLLDDLESSNSVDVSEHIDALKQILDSMQSGDCAAEPESVDSPTATPEIQQPTSEVAPTEPTPTTQPEAETPPPQAEPVKSSAEAKAPNSAASSTPKGETSLRVPISVVDNLMNLVGELVLSRNQLLQSISTEQLAAIKAVGPRINQVTAELQEAVMQTRLQPVGNVFNRFTRVVRDLNKKLNKKCKLVLEGADVEIDKTIVEALSDPMTHLVRNSLDHAIEIPADRVSKGKAEEGILLLSAVQEAGSVKIIIKDDGAGIDVERVKKKAVEKGILTPERAEIMTDREAARLIFEPGFSTAAVVSDVSGRGVGMDVVRTNIERLNGVVDVDTQLNVGTTISISLPLTLAIMPALLVRSGHQFIAIPQINIGELVRLRRDDIADRIGCIKGAKVLRSRGSLLPLIKLSGVLHTEDSINLDETDPEKMPRELDIVILEVGGSRFGLIADELFGSEEIVVKPLGQHFADCDSLAGATILGSGEVAMILDVKGIAPEAQLQDAANDLETVSSDKKDAQAGIETVLLFRNHPDEQFAVPMSLIQRIDDVKVSRIDSVAGQKVLQNRGGSMPLLSLEDSINAKNSPLEDRVSVVVFEVMGREAGLIVQEVKDLCKVDLESDDSLHRERGVMGSIVVEGKPTRVISLSDLAELALPDWFVEPPTAAEDDESGPPTILLAEDSNFFRKQLVNFLESKGYEVLDCEDGQVAWERLQDGEKVDMVVTDLEMPRLDGFELSRNIKQHPDFRSLPVIALTSLSSDEHRQRALDCGVDEYQMKLNQMELQCSVARMIEQSKATRKLEMAT